MQSVADWKNEGIYECLFQVRGSLWTPFDRRLIDPLTPSLRYFEPFLPPSQQINLNNMKHHNIIISFFQPSKCSSKVFKNIKISPMYHLHAINLRSPRTLSIRHRLQKVWWSLEIEKWALEFPNATVGYKCGLNLVSLELVCLPEFHSNWFSHFSFKQSCSENHCCGNDALSCIIHFW